MSPLPKRKRSGSSRASRHSKQYQRKGIDVSSYEEVLNDANKQDDFVIEREPMTDAQMKTYTKRQQAKLDKISRTAVNLEDERDCLPFPKAPTKSAKRLRQPQLRAEAVKPKKTKVAGSYDLWETEFVPSIRTIHKTNSEHILRETKKKLPNKPGSLRQKTSLLPAVALPAPGVSYNPTAEEYQEYVDKIVNEEAEMMESEERTAKKLKPEHEAIVTEQERALEQTEGLAIDPRFTDGDEEEEQKATEEEDKPEKAAVTGERKTKKDREKEAKMKKEEEQRLKKKALKLNENEIFKAKAINKQLAKDEVTKAKAAAERRFEKLRERMTKRQKLGRGKFEEEEAPFLLQEELTDSLRSLKPQGDLLTDRIKSMQKRNMLPIGGSRQKAKKTKLRKKFVEKRSAKEVTKGSRVI